MEDPEIIRLNIRHYHELLKLYCTPEARQQLVKLIVRAPLDVAEAEDRGR